MDNWSFGVEHDCWPPHPRNLNSHVMAIVGQAWKHLFFTELGKIHSMGKMSKIRVGTILSWKCLPFLKGVHNLRLREGQQGWGAGQPVLYSCSGQEQWETSKPPAQPCSPTSIAPVGRTGGSEGKGSLGLPTDDVVWMNLALMCWVSYLCAPVSTHILLPTLAANIPQHLREGFKQQSLPDGPRSPLLQIIPLLEVMQQSGCEGWWWVILGDAELKFLLQ